MVFLKLFKQKLANEFLEHDRRLRIDNLITIFKEFFFSNSDGPPLRLESFKSWEVFAQVFYSKKVSSKKRSCYDSE